MNRSTPCIGLVIALGVLVLLALLVTLVLLAALLIAILDSTLVVEIEGGFLGTSLLSSFQL